MSAPPEVPPAPRRRGRRVALIVTLAAVALIGVYAATVWAVSGSDVAGGTTVAGVDIGGMTVEQATQTLTTELADRATAPIPVTVGATSTEVHPASAGLAVDWAATAQRAAGPLWSPAELWRHLTAATDVAPVLTVDEAALTAAVQKLADQTATEPVEPIITYSKAGLATLAPGAVGTVLQVDQSARALSAAYLGASDTPVALPVTTTTPRVSDVEATRVLSTVAEPAVAKAVTISVDDHDVTLTPDVIAKTLTFAPAGSSLAPEVDAEALRKALADELDPLESAPVSARIVIRDGKPVIVKSRAGRTVAAADLASAVVAVLGKTTAADRVAELALTKAQPSFTTADAKALGIKERLSSFRQWFPPAAYRWQNVGQAAAYLNGTIIKPGGTFSMNDTIHERTYANGYTKGFIIKGGRFAEELGGGVSIITTATWTAGFYAGLERVEAHAHGLYISRYQAGLEATVAWGALDLRLGNNTGHGVLITAVRYSDGVRIEMWGTKKYDNVTASFTGRYNFRDFTTVKDDSPTCVASAGVRGFSIAVTRRRYIDGKVASSETWPTNYRATPHVICTNPNATSE